MNLLDILGQYLGELTRGYAKELGGFDPYYKWFYPIARQDRLRDVEKARRGRYISDILQEGEGVIPTEAVPYFPQQNWIDYPGMAEKLGVSDSIGGVGQFTPSAEAMPWVKVESPTRRAKRGIYEDIWGKYQETGEVPKEDKFKLKILEDLSGLPFTQYFQKPLTPSQKLTQLKSQATLDAIAQNPELVTRLTPFYEEPKKPEPTWADWEREQWLKGLLKERRKEPEQVSKYKDRFEDAFSKKLEEGMYADTPSDRLSFWKSERYSIPAKYRGTVGEELGIYGKGRKVRVKREKEPLQERPEDDFIAQAQGKNVNWELVMKDHPEWDFEYIFKQLGLR